MLEHRMDVITVADGAAPSPPW